MNDAPSIKLAKKLIKEGDRSQAMQVLNKLVQLNPNDELAWLWLANCINDSEKKRFCLQKALAIANELPSVPPSVIDSSVSRRSTGRRTSRSKKTVNWVALGVIYSISLIGIALIILGVKYLPSGLASALPSPIACNRQILNKTLNIVPAPPRTDTLGEWSEAMFKMGGAKEGTLSWAIEPRSNYGCLVKLSGDINGVETVQYAWFVDLDQKKVFADSDYARAIVEGWVSGSGNYNLLKGFPLPLKQLFFIMKFHRLKHS